LRAHRTLHMPVGASHYRYIVIIEEEGGSMIIWITIIMRMPVDAD